MLIPIPFLFLLLSHIQHTTCQTIQLQNNQIVSASSTSAEYQHYYFSVPTQIQLLAQKLNIYLSITSCNQPDLIAFLSTSNTTEPQNGIRLDNTNGLITWNSNHSVSEIWVAISANQTKDNSGQWSYEIAASTQQIMHPVYNNSDPTAPYITLDDTDRNSALFLSNALDEPFPNSTILITSGQPTGLSWSLCAAKLHSVPQLSINRTITTRGPTNATRYQFLISNLTDNASYQAYLLQENNGVAGISMPIPIKTKASAVCQLIYDLPFCNQVAYSVPSNSAVSRWDLAAQYDTQAQALFDPFDVSLSQFNCESTQYSLVRNCTDCYRDYKTWLCSVTIPRCTDLTSSAGLIQGSDKIKAAPAVRDVPINGSRNPWIDSTLQPSAWTELLPCIDLCYHVVQSCPPYLQFFCPVGDLASVQYGYWQTGNATVNGTTYQFNLNNPTCNRMGLDIKLLTLSSQGHKLRTFSCSFCIVFFMIFILL
ncbi:hypothetical protein BCV72DRAFT_78993 [Rhizopus microsporus var. microsporus]|nr:hypothetical protein BCV72DRAFT_78993 [Rhizopus microsporus var. microsporus]